MCRPFNFYQTKKIKTRYGAIKLHLFKQFQSNLLPHAPDARLFNLCKKKPHSLHVTLLLHHTLVNMISACMDLYLDHLIFMKEKKIKTPATMHLSLTTPCNSSQNPHSVHVNFTTSSHSSQYDFSMHGLILGLFNFHETKQMKPTFNVRKSPYFITLQSNYLHHVQTDAQVI